MLCPYCKKKELSEVHLETCPEFQKMITKPTVEEFLKYADDYIEELQACED